MLMTLTETKRGLRLAMVFLALHELGCGSLQTVEKRYPDYATAQAAGDLGNLWIPEVLPTSARDITVRYDTDSGETWIAFRFGGDLDDILPKITEVSRADQRRLDVHAVESAPWWPKALRNEVLRDSSQPLHFKVYSYTRRMEVVGGGWFESPAWLAIDESSSEACYWQGPRERRG
jgi:hypothetical protein